VAEITKIAWTDSTFNPWMGCQKVSDGCLKCYAEADRDHRFHQVEWGPHGERKRTTPGYWRMPRKWNADAARFEREHGRRHRVFCASLADVFDNKVPASWRADLFEVIRDTPQLDWFLLSKRPQNMRKMLPPDWGTGYPNVWLGATTESAKYYQQRWPILASIPAAIRFVSYEPAVGPLGPLDLGHVLPNWVICGGESGHDARSMQLVWVRQARDECRRYGVSFFMKQFGSNSGIPGVTGKGDDPQQWAKEFRIREYPQLP
jgi:protein gp37